MRERMASSFVHVWCAYALLLRRTEDTNEIIVCTGVAFGPFENITPCVRGATFVRRSVCQQCLVLTLEKNKYQVGTYGIERARLQLSKLGDYVPSCRDQSDIYCMLKVVTVTSTAIATPPPLSIEEPGATCHNQGT